MNFEEKLQAICGEEKVKCKESMRLHTTFQIGGEAEYFVTPASVTELQNILQLCKENKQAYYMIGNGSNLLVGDKGYKGTIIRCKDYMKEINIEDTTIRVQAGAKLCDIANVAMESELTGIEFAAGIPGTLGGAIVMNAGAYDGEMAQIIQQVTVLTPKGEILQIEKEQLDFGYRSSIISKKEYIVLEAQISLKKGEKKEIKAYMEELNKRRKDKQPLEYPSAGSTFKRPKGYFAGKLIDDSGLRGYQIGGAKISQKHCGFVVNAGNATAKDVTELITAVSKQVKEKYGVELEAEVKRIGEF